MEDRLSFAPFVLFEYEHEFGRYCLMLGEEEMEQVEAVFEAHELEASGYGWNDLVECVVRVRMPGFADALEFDSESATFAVNSDDLDAIRQLADLLRRAYHVPALLEQLIVE